MELGLRRVHCRFLLTLKLSYV